MPLLKNGDFTYKFPDGRKIIFGIRNGQVRKISTARFSEEEFRQALAEARKILRPKSGSVIEQKLPVSCRRLDQGAAAAEHHFRMMLPDF